MTRPISTNLPSGEEIRHAFEVVGRVMAYLVDCAGSASSATAPRFYTAKTCPAGARPFKRACASGRFQVFKEGKAWALLVSDFEAWIEAQGRTPAPKEATEPPVEVDPDRAELEAAGVRFAGPANDQRRAAVGGRRSR